MSIGEIVFRQQYLKRSFGLVLASIADPQEIGNSVQFLAEQIGCKCFIAMLAIGSRADRS
jgi:hypothetical protein